MDTVSMIALAFAGWQLLRGQAASGPMVTLPNGTRIGPGAVVYNPQGQVVGRTTPQQYAQAVAAQGRASGLTAVQTLGLVKTITGLGKDLYATIKAIVDGTTGATTTTGGGTATGDAGSSAEILRDRIAVDPDTAAVPDAATLEPAQVVDDASAWSLPSVPETIHVDVVGIDTAGNLVTPDGTPLTTVVNPDGSFAGFVDTFGTPYDVGAVGNITVDVPSVADIVTGG
jgi:hypothetical protein